VSEAAAYAFQALEGDRVQIGPPADEARVAADVAARAAATRAREEGLAAGLAEAREQLEPARSALLAAAARFSQAVEAVVPVAEERAVELAVVLAEKILSTALEADPALVAAVVTGALRRVLPGGPFVVEVNPADVELVRASLGDVERELGALPSLEVAGERRVGRGGCIVRTPEGELDARLERQLVRAAELLREP
jgi:flagellar biosynthesis/type III secretory pathway protein FliH